jgi:hypothetical protein
VGRYGTDGDPSSAPGRCTVSVTDWSMITSFRAIFLGPRR